MCLFIIEPGILDLHFSRSIFFVPTVVLANLGS